MTDVVIIDDWELRPEQNPQKGNREKSLFINPKDKHKYFFKKPVPKYSITEPHSEIIASEIGNHLNIEVVQHSFAFYNGEFGSLCKTVLKDSSDSGTLISTFNSEELIHGQQLLLAQEPDFDVKKGKAHSFQLIKKTLQNTERIRLDYEKFLKRIIQMIIFDSIIGNKDRHQENWALIETPRFIAYRDIETEKIKLRKKRTYRFSPLYDNGSSLGRELLEDRIKLLLNINDKIPFESYINRQTYHIRWYDKEIKLHDLIKNIKLEHPHVVNPILVTIKENYNYEKFADWIETYDDKLRDYNEKFCLSNNRKNLVKKLVDYRIKKLQDLK